MSSSLRIICFAAGAAALVAGRAPAKDSSVVRLMHEVEQLAAVRESLHRELLEWEMQQESMNHGMYLLKEEKNRLEHRLETQRNAAAEKSAEETERDQRALEQERSLRQTERDLDKYMARIDAVRELFPNLFQETLRKGLSHRLNHLFATATAVQREHQSISYTREVMNMPDEGHRQMEMIRLGHSQAYAVSPDDRHAAHGVWTGNQWEWSWDTSMASEIRKAVRVHQGGVSPRWVFLPITVAEEERP